MAIDLTNKPEDATHINPFNGLWIKCFGGNSGSYQFFKNGEWEMGFGCMSNSYLEIAKPEPWTGEGLPPVGAVCELRAHKLSEWCRAVIKFASRNVVVWDWEGEPAISGLCTRYAHEVEMRPIRTAEQIAEDNKKAIKQALNKLWDEDTRREEFIEKVYNMIVEAGKQVTP